MKAAELDALTTEVERWLEKRVPPGILFVCALKRGTQLRLAARSESLVEVRAQLQEVLAVGKWERLP